MLNCPKPTVTRAGYLRYLRDSVGIPESALPDNSTAIDQTLCAGLEYIRTGMGLEHAPIIFVRTAYNMATSLLLNYAEDEAGSKYFANMRKNLGLNDLSTGLMQSAADQGTAGTQQISQRMQNLSLADLQMLKDPYGRQVLSVLMQLGDLWGYTP